MEWLPQANVSRFVMPVLVVLGWYIADRVLKLAGRLFDGGISGSATGLQPSWAIMSVRRGSRGLRAGPGHRPLGGVERSLS